MKINKMYKELTEELGISKISKIQKFCQECEKNLNWDDSSQWFGFKFYVANRVLRSGGVSRRHALARCALRLAGSLGLSD